MSAADFGWALHMLGRLYLYGLMATVLLLVVYVGFVDWQGRP